MRILSVNSVSGYNNVYQIKNKQHLSVSENFADINFSKINNNRNAISFNGLGKYFADLFKKSPDLDCQLLFNESIHVPSKIWIDGELYNNANRIKYAEYLDNLTSKQKKQFVREFCRVTGFPDLLKMKNVMDAELINVTNRICEFSGYKPLFLGYASCCSLGKGVAFPGSDCDGLFLVVDKKIDYRKIDRELFGYSINQRLLDTTGKHFPEIFNIQQLMPYVEMADRIFEKIKNPAKIKRYKQNLLRSDNDFVKAGEFNIDIESKIKGSRNKNLMYLSAMFVEELRSGNVLINNLDKETMRKIKSSALYKYSNVVRQEGFSQTIKSKWDNRKNLCKNFNKLKNKQKFEICSEIYKESFGIKGNNTGGSYDKCDMGNILELVNILTTF